MPSLVALVPARAGSKRVPGKNIRPLAGHPLIAYAIAAARRVGLFADRVVCSTDSGEIAEIARWYGAEVPVLRPAEYADSTSPDIEWLQRRAGRLPRRTTCSRSIRARRARSAGRRRSAAPATGCSRSPARRLDPRRRAGQAAPRQDVAPRRRDDAPAARPVTPRRAVARQPVPDAAAGLRPGSSALEIAWTRVRRRTGRSAGRRVCRSSPRARGLSHRLRARTGRAPRRCSRRARRRCRASRWRPWRP